MNKWRVFKSNPYEKQLLLNSKSYELRICDSRPYKRHLSCLNLLNGWKNMYLPIPFGRIAHFTERTKKNISADWNTMHFYRYTDKGQCKYVDRSLHIKILILPNCSRQWVIYDDKLSVLLKFLYNIQLSFAYFL